MGAESELKFSLLRFDPVLSSTVSRVVLDQFQRPFFKFPNDLRVGPLFPYCVCVTHWMPVLLC